MARVGGGKGGGVDPRREYMFMEQAEVARSAKVNGEGDRKGEVSMYREGPIEGRGPHADFYNFQCRI